MQRMIWRQHGDHPAVERPIESHLQPCSGLLNCGWLDTAGGRVLVREGDTIVTDDSGAHTIEPFYDPRDPEKTRGPTA